MVDVVPQITGAALWITVAALGLVALVVATFLEQGRRRVVGALAHLSEYTRDWE